MSHGNTIIYSYGIELSRIATHSLYLFLNYLSYFVQMSMTRNKLCK